MDKILTIIIPTYNMEKYLRHCLDSLIVPNMDKVEVLVINDGSKDASSVIGHEYQDKYPQTFRVIDKENGNYGSCINRGLKEALGKYVKVLDSDDSFDNKVFESYITFLEENDADLIVNNYRVVNEHDETRFEKFYNLPSKFCSFDRTIKKIFNRKNFQMHAAAYKTDNIRRLNYHQTEGISYTDQQWIFTPLVSVNNLAYFNGILYNYLVGREGQTMSPAQLKKGVSQNQQCIVDLLKDYKKYFNKGNKFVNEYLYDQVMISLRTIFESYLIKYRELSLSGLMRFDEDIRSISPDLYKLSNRISMEGTCYHYVRNWHRSHKRDNSVIFMLMKFQSRAYCYLKRHLIK